jgi:hypothetical protein
MAGTVSEVTAFLSDDAARFLASEHARWSATTGWRLINSADSCGT